MLNPKNDTKSGFRLFKKYSYFPWFAHCVSLAAPSKLSGYASLVTLGNNKLIHHCPLYQQAASLACAVRLANATRSPGAALRASQRITLRDWQT